MHFLGLDRTDPKKFQILQIIASLLEWSDGESAPFNGVANLTSNCLQSSGSRQGWRDQGRQTRAPKFQCHHGIGLPAHHNCPPTFSRAAVRSENHWPSSGPDFWNRRPKRRRQATHPLQAAPVDRSRLEYNTTLFAFHGSSWDRCAEFPSHATFTCAASWDGVIWEHQ